MKKRTEPDGLIRPLKVGNLFREIPWDVNYGGCSDQDCIEGCNLGKGHCQRLENAFKAAHYETDAT